MDPAGEMESFLISLYTDVRIVDYLWTLKSAIGKQITGPRSDVKRVQKPHQWAIDPK